MLTIPYPHIPPELVRIGPLAIRWYGLMYVVGYVVGYRIARDRIRRGLLPMPEAALDALIGYLLLGMLVGARLTYALVYDRPTFAADPLEIVRVWHGGLSFHGAVLGMTIASAIFARRHHVPFLALADTLAISGAPGLFFGRLGNFINGELYGRPSDVPWAMVFPADPLHVPRHPSQLYEAVVEGVLLFLFLAALERRLLASGRYRHGMIAAAFLIGYACARFALEFTREPDAQLGFVLGSLSMGQLLSIVTGLAGVALLLLARRQGERVGLAPPPSS